MKFRFGTVVAFVIIVLVGDVYIMADTSARSEQNDKRLQLQIQVDKDRYLPGQVITVNFKILNNTNQTLMLDPGANVKTGRLQVFVSDGNDEFLQYTGPRWGLLDGIAKGSIEVQPQKFVETSATVLHNRVVATYHLNKHAAKELTKGRIDTEYAFPRPGVYYIKAKLFDRGYVSHIESEPVKILIDEPQGPDLDIWNTLKTNGAYALFLQTGEISGHAKDPKADEIVQLLEDLVKRYPTSKYADTLRTCLAKRQK
jgi:hypothetical protein